MKGIYLPKFSLLEQIIIVEMLATGYAVMTRYKSF